MGLISADPRLLGALRKTVAGGGGAVWDERMDEMHLSVFHSVSVSRNSISSVAWYTFNSFF